MSVFSWFSNVLGFSPAAEADNNSEEIEIKAAPPQTNASCLHDIITYFQGLNGIQEHKFNDDSKEEQKGNAVNAREELPTASHYFRTGYLYRGKHRDALSWFSKKTPENKEFAKLAIALVERIAQIAPEKLDGLRIDPQANPETEQVFVKQLHTIYQEVAKEHYGTLLRNVEQIIDHLFSQFSTNKVISRDDKNTLRNYIHLVLEGEDFTAAKKAFKEQCEEPNANITQLENKFGNDLASKVSTRQMYKNRLDAIEVNVGKLTYDAQYYATQLGKHKDELDKQFRDFKKDINRVAQKIGTHRAGLKPQDPEVLLNNPWRPSYRVVDFGEEIPAVSEDKQERRNKKERIFNWALTISVLLAFGESVVAAVGIAGLSLTGAVLIIIPALVFCSALYANYSLVLRDTYDTLKGIWEGRTFLDKDGKPLSLAAKIGVWVVGVFFSFSSGAAYAALSGKCLWPLATKFFAYVLPVAFGGSVAPALAVCLTGAVALATCVGLSIIFFVQVKNFITHKKWESAGAYLKKEFWWDSHISKEASWRETFKHWASNGVKFIKLVLGLSTTFLITFISFGVFKEKIGGWIGMIPRLAANIGAVITLILTWGNALVMSTFGVSKNQASLDRFTPGGFIAAVVEFGLGIASIPFLMLETSGRCVGSLLRVNHSQELAPVSTGRALNWACGGFESFVGWLSSWFRISPTFSPELVVAEEANTEAQALPEPIKKVLKSQTYIQKRFMNNAALVPNSIGQAALFAPYGPPALPSLSARVATALTSGSKLAFSLLPNHGAVEAQVKADRVGMPQQTIRANAGVA